ncbi:hypothetical protein ACFQ88_00055 [Paenibacillus sp. NPDC056579]|uniref:hypothetical protein n=1 Tax=Paenibacillus sp. NPDC056579 TaxID=3345871 RepID=UPI0036BED955
MPEWLLWLVSIAVILIAGRAVLPVMMRMLSEHGITDTNYKQSVIPTACGLLLWLLFCMTMVIARMTSGLGGAAVLAILHYNGSIVAEYGAALSIVALVGFLDDAVGVKSYKGFAGHWRHWREKGVIGTGMVKAVGGSAAALLIAFSDSLQDGRTIWERLIPFLIVVLMTNAINLLDTRPGRALKGFWGAVTVLLLIAVEGVEKAEIAWLMLPVLIGAALLLLPDLKGRLMLGDTGANLLGFAMGSWIVMLAGTAFQTAVLGLLVVLHAVTWRFSLTKLIARSRVLTWLDAIGRGRPDKI